MKKTMLLFACALMLGSTQAQAVQWCEDEYILGDFNHDGVVDDADTVILETELYGNVAPCNDQYVYQCLTMYDCTEAGGFWWGDNTCHSGPDIVTNTVESAGQVWMDRNLGASQVATSMHDEYAFGDFYQWGRGTDGHEKWDSETTFTKSTTDDPGHDRFITVSSLDSSHNYDWRWPQNDELWQGEFGINNVCPAGFRLPTRTEMQTEINGMSPTQYLPFYSPLKLPMAGRRIYSDGNIDMSVAGYWTSTVDESRGFSYALMLKSAYYLPMNMPVMRSFGFHVRCIVD